ncbi:MAG: excalibur calcium-binding domain-containing protein [Acidimicrobiales bacterium]
MTPPEIPAAHSFAKRCTPQRRSWPSTDLDRDLDGVACE